jgi:hypothetical protein
VLDRPRVDAAPGGEHADGDQDDEQSDCDHGRSVPEQRLSAQMGI